MTRKEALTVKTKIIASTDASRNGLVENIVTTPEVEFLINKIYDDFEKDLTMAVSKKTCDGCIHKPRSNENYPIECGTCSRFYADGFKEKKDV